MLSMLPDIPLNMFVNFTLANLSLVSISLYTYLRINWKGKNNNFFLIISVTKIFKLSQEKNCTTAAVSLTYIQCFLKDPQDFPKKWKKKF